MAVEMVAGYGWVTLSLMANVILNLWMASQVGAARRRYKVEYPTMYAVESENKDAKAFNCVQRGHQNALEFMPTFLALLLVGGLQYPRVAAILGAAYTVARYLYFKAYSTGGAKQRFSTGGGAHFPALMGLFACTLAFTLHQFFPDLV